MTLEDPFQPPVVARAQAIVDKMAAEADEAMTTTDSATATLVTATTATWDNVTWGTFTWS